MEVNYIYNKGYNRNSIHNIRIKGGYITIPPQF